MCSEKLISLFYYILSECQVIFFNYSQVFLIFTVNDVSPLVVRVYGIAGRAPNPREALYNIPRKV